MERAPLSVRTRFVVSLAALLPLVIGMPAAQAAGGPTISGFSPACGPVGTSVTISGGHFAGTTLVEFNGVDQTTFTVNGGTITASVPSGATTGKIRVTAGGKTGESKDDFTVSSSCAPTISNFSPTSGPVGTVVTINGSIFVGTTAVKFDQTSASTFSWNPSGMQITATVPSGATTGKISVTTPAGTATSSQDFTVTAAPGAPTITSFAPTSGPVGTSVVITGTNLTGATTVRFNKTAATSFTVNSATQITATVPTGATTGKISVTTPAGTATSTSDFTVTSLASHDRSISLGLRRHLVARGTVTVNDGFAACSQAAPVWIQRRVSGSWRTIDTSVTDNTGFYRKGIADRSGKYRAVATRVELTNDVCKRAVSNVVFND